MEYGYGCCCGKFSHIFGRRRLSRNINAVTKELIQLTVHPFVGDDGSFFLRRRPFVRRANSASAFGKYVHTVELAFPCLPLLFEPSKQYLKNSTFMYKIVQLEMQSCVICVTKNYQNISCSDWSEVGAVEVYSYLRSGSYSR